MSCDKECRRVVNLCASLLYSVVRVRCRRKESSCSLSHLLMSFLLLSTDISSVTEVKFDIYVYMNHFTNYKK